MTKRNQYQLNKYVIKNVLSTPSFEIVTKYLFFIIRFSLN